MNSPRNGQVQREWEDRDIEHPVVTAPRARQGVTGHNVRYVLGFGVAAVIVCFVIVYLVYFG
jgi:hypothetical protein